MSKVYVALLESSVISESSYKIPSISPYPSPFSLTHFTNQSTYYSLNIFTMAWGWGKSYSNVTCQHHQSICTEGDSCMQCLNICKRTAYDDAEDTYTNALLCRSI